MATNFSLDSWLGGFICGLSGKPSPVVTRALIRSRESHQGIIPDGATYYVNMIEKQMGYYSNYKAKLTAGDTFPDTPTIGDVYVYQDYEYRYGMRKSPIYSATWEKDTMVNGWGVMSLDKTKVAYPPILESINGHNVVCICGAFSGCANMTSIPRIPFAITMASESFEDCLNLTVGVLPPNTCYVQESFEGCEKLKIGIIPNGVTTLRSTFSGCTLLESVIMPDTVTGLYGTFSGCEELKRITIPDGVTRIDASTFSGCRKLESMKLPSNLTYIGSYAFSSCQSIKEIVIPHTVRTIDRYAFYNCSSLEKVTILGNVSEIPYSVFYGCSSLKSVELPQSVTTILNGAFEACSSLRDIIIPANVNKILYSVFKGCSSLSIVTMMSEIPPTLRDTTFSECLNLTQIIVPKGCADAYKTAAYWSEYADIIVEQEG